MSKKILVIEKNVNIEILKNVTYKNLLVISTLANIRLHCNYVITDYSLLTPTNGNRSGIDNGRVNAFITKMTSGVFYSDMCLIQIDIYGNIVEGHHRFEAMRLLGIPIKVTVVEPKSVEQIAEYNTGMNPNWKTIESFDSAISVGCKTAAHLSTVRATLCEKYKLDPKKFKSNEIYGILVKNPKCFGGVKYAPTVREWIDSDKNYSLVNSTEFKKNIKQFAQLKRHIRGERDAYKIAKKVMDLHFNTNIDFKLGTLLEALNYTGFKLEKYNSKTIEDRAMYLYNREVKNKRTA